MTPPLRLQLSEATVPGDSDPNRLRTGSPAGLLLDPRLSVDALVMGMLLVAHAREPEAPVLTIADLTHQLPGTRDEIRDALIELFAVGWLQREGP